MNNSLVKQSKTYLNKNDPEYLINEVVKNSENKGTEKSAENSIMASKYIYSQNLKNLTLLSEAVEEEYKSYIVQVARDLEKEFKIVTSSEKILVNNLVISHVCILQLTSKLNKYLVSSDMLMGSDKYCSILSKELDRAYKHYDYSMRLLMNLKAKPVNVNINTFQQLNVVEKDKLISENH
jgi:hypothetical protein